MDSYFVDGSCQVKNLSDIYIKYFGYKDNGYFVDIGAYDGFSHSNTMGLAMAGWSGICYEPIYDAYRVCIDNHTHHKNIKVINKAIGNRNGTVDFYISGPLSTYSDYYRNTNFWAAEYRGARIVTVDIVRLDDTLIENDVPVDFDVLSLDVEGSETDVLMYFNINYWRPKMAIVEAQEHHPAPELRNQAPFINKFFKDAGYDKIYSDEINNIYVINEEKMARIDKKIKRELKKRETLGEGKFKLKVDDSSIGGG